MKTSLVCNHENEKIWKKVQQSRKKHSEQLVTKSMLRLKKWFTLKEMKKKRENIKQQLNYGRTFYWIDMIGSFHNMIEEEANDVRNNAEMMTEKFWKLQTLLETDAKMYADRAVIEQMNILLSNCDNYIEQNQQLMKHLESLNRYDFVDRSILNDFETGVAAVSSNITEPELKTVYKKNLKLLQTMKDFLKDD